MRPIFLVMALLAPLPALAEFTCEYTLECFEQEACQVTDFTIEITPGELETLAGVTSGIAELSDVAGTQLADYVAAEGLVVVENRASGGDTLFRLVIGPEGVSRYQLLMLDGPMAITYHGLCEGSE